MPPRDEPAPARERPRLPALLCPLLLALAPLAACSEGPAPPAADEGGLAIVATTGMVGDVVAAVAAERARVDVLMGPGVDPHLYKATRSDIAKLMDADAIFYNGLLLEGKMTDGLISAGRSRPVIAITERLDESFLLEPPEFEGHYDPHVWMDPSAWTRTIDVVLEELTDLDPAGEGDFRSNAERYRAELLELDAWCERTLATIPEHRRILVTAHDAFNYFSRRYGFEVVGIQGISTDSEAATRDIERIVRLIVERKIPAVFVETTVSERSVRALIEGARARGHRVVIGGALFSDAMGEPDAYEGTYVGMIDHNVTTITRALGGEAPARGMNGRLRASEGTASHDAPGAEATAAESRGSPG